MKTKYILGMVLFLSIQISFSQTADIDDDMEWEAGDCPEHWINWNPPRDCPELAKFGHTGLQSIYISNEGTTDVVLDLGGKIFDVWYLRFYMYVPKGKEAYLSIQGQSPPITNEKIVGNFIFNEDLVNPGIGLIDDTAIGEVNFNFPHDEWFRVFIAVDISGGIGAATWELRINDVEVIPPGTSFTNEAGDIPTSLGGLDFSVLFPNTSFFIDNVCYLNDFEPDSGGCYIAGIDDFNKSLFKLYPNPVQNIVSIESREPILSVTVFSQLGQEVINSKATNAIDVSTLANGLYFIEVETDSGRGMQKFIKK